MMCSLSFSNDSQCELVSHKYRNMHEGTHPSLRICIRDRVGVTSLNALLAGCESNSLHCLHLFGIKSDVQETERDEILNGLTSMDQIVLESLAQRNSSSLRILSLGASVPLESHHTKALGKNCTGLLNFIIVH